MVNKVVQKYLYLPRGAYLVAYIIYSLTITHKQYSLLLYKVDIIRSRAPYRRRAPRIQAEGLIYLY